MVAEFESDLIRLRTREGMKVAKAKGRLRGKQPKLNRRQEAHLVSLVHSGEYSTAEVADLFGVGRSTVYRAIERQGIAAKAGLAEATSRRRHPTAPASRIRHPRGTPAANNVKLDRNALSGFPLRTPRSRASPTLRPVTPSGDLGQLALTVRLVCPLLGPDRLTAHRRHQGRLRRRSAMGCANP
jgi:excisionase family DNA binding protein